MNMMIFSVVNMDFSEYMKYSAESNSDEAFVMKFWGGERNLDSSQPFSCNIIDFSDVSLHFPTKLYFFIKIL